MRHGGVPDSGWVAGHIRFGDRAALLSAAFPPSLKPQTKKLHKYWQPCEPELYSIRVMHRGRFEVREDTVSVLDRLDALRFDS